MWSAERVACGLVRRASSVSGSAGSGWVVSGEEGVKVPKGSGSQRSKNASWMEDRIDARPSGTSNPLPPKPHPNRRRSHHHLLAIHLQPHPTDSAYIRRNPHVHSLYGDSLIIRGECSACAVWARSLTLTVRRSPFVHTSPTSTSISFSCLRIDLFSRSSTHRVSLTCFLSRDHLPFASLLREKEFAQSKWKGMGSGGRGKGGG